VAAALEQQLRRPAAPAATSPPLTLPTWDGCAAGVLQIYRDVVEASSCAS
jgi:hypothetical protein